MGGFCSTEKHEENCAFFQIPDKYLTAEQAKKQRQFAIDFNAEELKTKQQSDPTSREITASLEQALWIILLKLAERTFSYHILVEAFLKWDSEKVANILVHNLKIFEQIEKKSVDSLKLDVGVLKTNNFFTTQETQVQANVNPYAFGKLFEKQCDENQELQVENKKIQSLQNNSSLHGYVKVNIVETSEPTLKQEKTEPKVVKSEGSINDSGSACETTPPIGSSDDFQAVENNTPNESAQPEKTEDFVEHDSKDKSSESDSNLLNFEREITKIMEGMNREELNMPESTLVEDKEKVERDKKEYEMMIKAHVKKESEEQDEIDKALEKENIRLDSLIRKKIEEAENMSRKLKEMEEQTDKERKERSEKSEEEFRRKLEEQKREQEEVLRKIREKREEMEREMDRIHEETLKAIYMKQQVFWKCVELKMKWEEKENEWTDYLKRLRTSVARTKIQYMTFQRETRNYSEDNEFEKNLIEFELDTLQRKTLQSYDLLYQSFIFIKNLANNFPDRVFILILLKNLKHVTDRVCISAMAVNNVRGNLANLLVLGDIFGALNSHEILQTWNLKELSKTARMEDYEKIEDPLIYEYKTSGEPKIVEVVEENQDNNDAQTEATTQFNHESHQTSL